MGQAAVEGVASVAKPSIEAAIDFGHEALERGDVLLKEVVDTAEGNPAWGFTVFRAFIGNEPLELNQSNQTR